MKDDLVGRRFGKLKVIHGCGFKIIGSRRIGTWFCVCDCGRTKIARRDALVGGCTKSCGCLYFADRHFPEPPRVRNARWIPLGNGKFSLVDRNDYSWLSKYRWCLNHKYAQRRERGRIVWMHHEILRPPRGFMGDHISRSTLDNRRCNLRIVDKSENNQNAELRRHNSSGYTGVGWMPKRKKWRATIQKDKRQIHLGVFKSKKLASCAYDEAAKRLYGRFAKTNKRTLQEVPWKR